jgi:cyclopropane-fatty-acyl-phospholipid synthase
MSLALALGLAERGLVPETVVRYGIRRLCRRRLAELRHAPPLARVLAELGGAPVAPLAALANAQHYELPSRFFELVLGPHLKYSCAVWPDGAETLAEAEAAALALTCERAEIADGQEILELGCGWGSLSLHLARRYPNARITAVSNSVTQRAFLEARGFRNLRVVTADIAGFDPGRRFDRVVSVEMFEHLRNWPEVFRRVAGWVAPGGKFFGHVFCHAAAAYPFEVEGAGNWLGRHFFSGGMMPAYELLPAAAAGFRLEARWWIDGVHYRRTAAAWRRNLDRRRAEVLAVLREHYGGDAERWFGRWRLFFLACEELFGFAGGGEWGVGHYRLSPRDAR